MLVSPQVLLAVFVVSDARRAELEQHLRVVLVGQPAVAAGVKRSHLGHRSLLPLVLPQFVIGAILGYTRVTYGLWASILLHALHNGAFISLVLLASSAG